MPSETAPIRLTSLSHGAGCACKIGAAQLGPLLEELPRFQDPNLLVDSSLADDAAVYQLSDELCVVMTTDFFTPIVDDPYDFGRVAATNALSDIYAMGAEPLLALNLVAYSLERLGPAALADILRGGADVVSAAGAVIGGGHSIDDAEPKYGLAVLGTVHPDRLITNAGGTASDCLYLSKPLGSGLVSTAAKRGLADDGLVAAATTVLTTLNADASRAAINAHAHAMTDVTGFGLLGHLHELSKASGLSAEVEAERVPAIPGVLELAANERCVAGGSRRNAEHADAFTTWADDVRADRRVLLTDAMTSGGLLVAASENARADDRLGERIGVLVDGKPGQIRVH